MTISEGTRKRVETRFVNDEWAVIIVRNNEGEVIRKVGVPVHKLISDEIVQQVADSTDVAVPSDV